MEPAVFNEPALIRPRFNVTVQDVLLAVIFGALLFLAHNWLERMCLGGLACLQLIEGRVTWLSTVWGRSGSVILQLLICYALFGWTSALASEYYPVLLLPVISTASYVGVAGTVLTAVAAIGAYLSFLVYVDWSQFTIEAESVHTLEIRCLALAVSGVLVNSLGQARRAESIRYKQAAEQLALANRHLVDAQSAVRRSERLAALGQLSAGLAHELRNPLGSIKGSADLLSRSASQNDPIARELAGIISEEVDRTNSLVTRFLDFARPLEPRREPVDIAAIIDRAAMHARVPVSSDYSPDLPPLQIDPALMEQVFINLLSNAAQASAAGAVIRVATRPRDGEVEISVTDEGCGIPADKMETIFNPFVTTKQTGVGLGLAIVSKIVDQHGGRMTVESEPGQGSTFRVFLPLEK